jgi:hypothetical protein
MLKTSWMQCMTIWKETEVLMKLYDFSKLLDKKLFIIHEFPFIYPAYEGNESVRHCVISK